jgi:hypothetical protein
LHADIMTSPAKTLRAHAEGEVKIPVLGASGDFESESVDVTALEGEAEAYPEGDENFPELWNQQRATMMQIMDSPYGMELKKEPGNAELFAKLTGIPELKIPGRDSWRKTAARRSRNLPRFPKATICSQALPHRSKSIPTIITTSKPPAANGG